MSPLDTEAPEPGVSVLYVVAKPGRDCMILLLLLYNVCGMWEGKSVVNYKQDFLKTKTYSCTLTTTSRYRINAHRRNARTSLEFR